MEYRNYLNIFNSNYNFADLGYADGYADLPSDEKTILSQLYGKIKEEELVYSLDMYLQGFVRNNILHVLYKNMIK